MSQLMLLFKGYSKVSASTRVPGGLASLEAPLTSGISCHGVRIGSEFEAPRRELLCDVGAYVAAMVDEWRQLQHEIDALVAHLYGLSEDGLRHILYAPYTFPLVKREIKDGVMREFGRVEELLPYSQSVYYAQVLCRLENERKEVATDQYKIQYPRPVSVNFSMKRLLFVK